MNKEEMKGRLKAFVIGSARLINKLPFNIVNKAYSQQLVRCSASTAANYRAALRAKSTADFVNKLKIVEEETDESILFLELLDEMNPGLKMDIAPLIKEANELLAIIVASIVTVRRRMESKS